jgi:hypothetical protein
MQRGRVSVGRKAGKTKSNAGWGETCGDGYTVGFISKKLNKQNTERKQGIINDLAECNGLTKSLCG